MGKNEISATIREGINRSGCWERQPNKYYSTIVDMGREIGLDMNQCPTSKLLIAVDEAGLIRSAYPIEMVRIK